MPLCIFNYGGVRLNVEKTGRSVWATRSATVRQIAVNLTVSGSVLWDLAAGEIYLLVKEDPTITWKKSLSCLK